MILSKTPKKVRFGGLFLNLLLDENNVIDWEALHSVNFR